MMKLCIQINIKHLLETIQFPRSPSSFCLSLYSYNSNYDDNNDNDNSNSSNSKNNDVFLNKYFITSERTAKIQHIWHSAQSNL